MCEFALRLSPRFVPSLMRAFWGASLVLQFFLT